MADSSWHFIYRRKKLLLAFSNTPVGTKLCNSFSTTKEYLHFCMQQTTGLHEIHFTLSADIPSANWLKNSVE